jgi:hypothetical protein
MGGNKIKNEIRFSIQLELMVMAQFLVPTRLKA